MKTYSLPKLANPARRALASAGIKQLSDITKFTEEEIEDLHGMGGQAIKSLREAMEAKKLAFKQE